MPGWFLLQKKHNNPTKVGCEQCNSLKPLKQTYDTLSDFLELWGLKGNGTYKIVTAVHPAPIQADDSSFYILWSTKSPYTRITRTNTNSTGKQDQLCICWLSSSTLSTTPGRTAALFLLRCKFRNPSTFRSWGLASVPLRKLTHPIQGHPVVYLIVWEHISVTPSLTSCWSQSRPWFWSPHQFSARDQCNLQQLVSSSDEIHSVHAKQQTGANSSKSADRHETCPNSVQTPLGSAAAQQQKQQSSSTSVSDQQHICDFLSAKGGLNEERELASQCSCEANRYRVIH
jgi:hypothetical protein